MFFGQKEVLIDEKSRLVLPANYRGEFPNGQVYATFGLDDCIDIYSEKTYLGKREEIRKLSDYDKVSRDFKRTFASNTFPLMLDSHNRILLPKQLLEKKKIGKKVRIVGNRNHLEVWDSETFQKYEETAQQDYSNNAQGLIGK
ncbi:MAG: hypothetical protein PUI77_01680 [Mollicutes bacterium]|nr:hypothetical protein [Mollicutes bacterium]MDD7613795.1 hypothetical protein [Mollicutes bacterium]MDY4643282.1 hypothetical protein [Candidatus Enterosoma sp.]MDY5852173.1 hypothetical protein [Candidatus Enterosoma sp.]